MDEQTRLRLRRRDRAPLAVFTDALSGHIWSDAELLAMRGYHDQYSLLHEVPLLRQGIRHTTAFRQGDMTESLNFTEDNLALALTRFRVLHAQKEQIQFLRVWGHLNRAIKTDGEARALLTKMKTWHKECLADSAGILHLTRAGHLDAVLNGDYFHPFAKHKETLQAAIKSVGISRSRYTVAQTIFGLKPPLLTMFLVIDALLVNPEEPSGFRLR